MSRQFQGLSLLEPQEFCCAFMSQYDVGDIMSVRSLLSCVFYSRTVDAASFVKTATAAAARVLMAAAHLWIKQAAERGAKPIYSAHGHCTVTGPSLNLSAASPLSTLMSTAACLFCPKGVKW